MKPNRAIKIGLGVFVLIATSIFYWQYTKYQKDQEKKLENAIPDWVYVTPAEVLEIQYFGGNKKNIIIEFEKDKKDAHQNKKYKGEIVEEYSMPPMFTQKYLIQENSKVRSQVYSGKEAMADYYELIVYKINGTNLDKYKTISLIEKIKDYKDGWEPIGHSGIYQYDGQEFLKINIRNIKTAELSGIYFNIETEEIVSNIEIEDKETEYDFFTDTTFRKKPNVPHIYYSFRINSVVFSKHELDDLSGAFIGEVYPEIASKLKKGKRIEIHMYEENEAARIAELLVPKGENPYGNVTLDGINSSDKRDHEINSIADFIKWYNGFSTEEREEILNRQ
ncbi:hypothetical protein [Isobaculum melis]|uniref:Uncharacterized protein n=1 Tax=Isobaculum melis TaxID=142588 RepID=A0A1H9UJ06_9LACT|nr:hypothetical protein [Isobaculum melis]SES09500.1 hypothetical protein SAMN04488559_13313 [Isobaculum melis]